MVFKTSYSYFVRGHRGYPLQKNYIKNSIRIGYDKAYNKLKDIVEGQGFQWDPKKIRDWKLDELDQNYETIMLEYNTDKDN